MTVRKCVEKGDDWENIKIIVSKKKEKVKGRERETGADAEAEGVKCYDFSVVFDVEIAYISGNGRQK